jgi:DNA-binding transcriptional regulator PaaX
VSLAAQSGSRSAWIEKSWQMKSDSLAAGHRHALRQRVNRCWDLLQQQQAQVQTALNHPSVVSSPDSTGAGE